MAQDLLKIRPLGERLLQSIDECPDILLGSVLPTVSLNGVDPDLCRIDLGFAEREISIATHSSGAVIPFPFLVDGGPRASWRRPCAPTLSFYTPSSTSFARCLCAGVRGRGRLFVELCLRRIVRRLWVEIIPLFFIFRLSTLRGYASIFTKKN